MRVIMCVTTSYIYVLCETISICGNHMSHYKYSGHCITRPCQQSNAHNIAMPVPNSGADVELRYHHGHVMWRGTAHHQIDETVTWCPPPPNCGVRDHTTEHTIWWRGTSATPPAFGIMVTSNATLPLRIEQWRKIGALPKPKLPRYQWPILY
jgi:hypothetical protein